MKCEHCGTEVFKKNWGNGGIVVHEVAEPQRMHHPGSERCLCSQLATERERREAAEIDWSVALVDVERAESVAIRQRDRADAAEAQLAAERERADRLEREAALDAFAAEAQLASRDATIARLRASAVSAIEQINEGTWGTAINTLQAALAETKETP